MNRQKAALAVLVALFFCSLIYSFTRMPRQERAARLTYQPGMTAQQARQAPYKGTDEAKVRLDLLDKGQGTPPGGGRNIFQPLYAVGGKKSTVPLPPPPPPPEKKAVPPPVAVQAPPPPQVVQQTPLQRDMATFTFLGFLKKDSNKTIFLSNGKEIFLVRKGDKISGKYVVSSLTDDAITISSASDSGEIVIPLVENRPLSAPRK